MMRWIGIICIIGACSACGFSMAGSYLFMERCLRQMQNALEVMLCQMEYRMTALPELCGIVASACGGPIGQVFQDLGQELQTGDAPNASACMAYALAKNNQLPESCQGILKQIGSNLGQLDLESQLRGLTLTKEETGRLLKKISEERSGRIRSYRALGICGGAALTILLL